jgi:DNA primase catalytic subunit
MKNTMKKGFLFLVLALLAAGSVFAQNDTWSNVTRINQVNGTWNGKSSATLTFRKFMESQGVAWTSDIQKFYGNMNIKVDLNLTMSINARNRTGTIIGTETFTFSGGNINDAWSALRDALAEDGAAVNDRNRSIATPINVSDSVTDSEIREYRINQNGGKISVPFSKLGLDYIPEYFVFNKQ